MFGYRSSNLSGHVNLSLGDVKMNDIFTLPVFGYLFAFSTIENIYERIKFYLVHGSLTGMVTFHLVFHKRTWLFMRCMYVVSLSMPQARWDSQEHILA